jgi:RNA-binding protein
MSLSNRQLKFLRGLCHHLKPVVIVGDKGLSENVQTEIETALDHHELIKVKLKTDRDTRAAWANQIQQSFGAEPVQSIGQVVSFYRRNPRKPVIELPS